MAASDTIFQAEVDLQTDLNELGYVGQERDAIERLLGQIRQVRRMLDTAPVTTYQQLETLVVEDLMPAIAWSAELDPDEGWAEAIDSVAAKVGIAEPKSRFERLFGPDLV